MDFLLHEVLIFTFFGRRSIEGNDMDFGLDGPTVQRLHLHPLTRHDRHLVRLKEDDALGVLHNGRDIGSNEIFTLAQAEHNTSGVADAGADDFIGFVGRHQDDAVRALDLLKGAPGRFDQVLAGGLVPFDQLNDGLCVGV